MGLRCLCLGVSVLGLQSRCEKSPADRLAQLWGHSVKHPTIPLCNCQGHENKENLRNEASIHLPADDGAMHGTGVANFLSHIDMRTATGDVCIGWLASQTDMLAEDWQIVD